MTASFDHGQEWHIKDFGFYGAHVYRRCTTGRPLQLVEKFSSVTKAMNYIRLQEGNAPMNMSPAPEDAPAPAFPQPSHLTNDARNTILSKLREALNDCAEQDDYDAILFVVALMKKTQNEP